ncbi:hypothetical protein [Paenibacillus sp. SYP-B4298]|uniref:hypothetical protein n=1 Tax=Paenibacillus sp. SYP-B4298 TaxID=2996034 RepID=UPI0022DCE835|nr:hypothetical protein [Paenibacillus sp. SYP-B4298]
MKGYYRLLNAEFAAWLRAIILLCAGALGTPLLLIHAATNDYGPYTVVERYETLYVSSGAALTCGVYILLLLAYYVRSVYRAYSGSKSIYTFLTLPVRREALYAAKLTTAATALLLLLAAQGAGAWLGYELAAARAFRAGGEGYVMHNGWFLAVIRSEWFRMLLPFSFSRLLSTVAIAAALLTGTYYATLCERSRKLWGEVAVIAAVLLIIRVAGYRMSEPIYYGEPSGLYWSSALLLLLSAWFIGHSLQLLRRGTVA